MNPFFWEINIKTTSKPDLDSVRYLNACTRLYVYAW